MPQMMPLNWLYLFISFSMIFLFFITLNYYAYNPYITHNNLLVKINNFKFNWKW
uniref:ATP synthase complex subunit 8 n=1 Tax=Oecetis caucula TaxID=2904905 RepID=A0A9E8RTW6_9NEOP|nr:ATP synthase F0 subunit 8 [Oecetis caucula]UZZ44211.1 ATP synthase F0 subunit 8 [Oecetis caucula]